MIGTFSAALAVASGVSATEIGGGTQSHERPGAASSMDQRHNAMSFSRLDTNQDGMVSEQEAASNTRLSERFQRLDSDNSGSLDKGEFAQFEVQPTQSEQEMERAPSQEGSKVPDQW